MGWDKLNGYFSSQAGGKVFQKIYNIPWSTNTLWGSRQRHRQWKSQSSTDLPTNTHLKRKFDDKKPFEYFRQLSRKQASKFRESHVLQLRHLPPIWYQFRLNSLWTTYVFVTAATVTLINMSKVSTPGKSQLKLKSGFTPFTSVLEMICKRNCDVKM